MVFNFKLLIESDYSRLDREERSFTFSKTIQSDSRDFIEIDICWIWINIALLSYAVLSRSHKQNPGK